MARPSGILAPIYICFVLLTMAVLTALWVCGVPGSTACTAFDDKDALGKVDSVFAAGPLNNTSDFSLVIDNATDPETNNSDRKLLTSSQSLIRVTRSRHSRQWTAGGSNGAEGMLTIRQRRKRKIQPQYIVTPSAAEPFGNGESKQGSILENRSASYNEVQPGELQIGESSSASNASDSAWLSLSDNEEVPTVEESFEVSSVTPDPRPEINWEHKRGFVPADFNWEQYLEYYPDLRRSGVNTEDAARSHYAGTGREEGRVHKKLRLLLRYTAGTGLMNQQYSHVSAFALAVQLGAEVVLPPAVYRDSFGKRFSEKKEKNEVIWSPAPTQTLVDVERIIKYWADKGIVVHRAPAITPFPDLTTPQTAFPAYDQPGIDKSRIVRFGNVYLGNLEIQDLVEAVQTRVLTHASELLKLDPDLVLDYMVIELPCTLFMIRTLSNLEMISNVAKNLYFSDTIHALADKVINAVTNNGQTEYNAIHLRMEKDAEEWTKLLGGSTTIWDRYFGAMVRAGFRAQLPLYMASGLLTYGAHAEMQNTTNMLQSTGLCGDILYKEMYISQMELDALNSEQNALLDFLVLAKAKNFVGFGCSTFSYYLREYRALHNISKVHSVMVDAARIGTDPLFSSAGTLID